jgi:hypothetical protein
LVQIRSGDLTADEGFDQIAQPGRFFDSFSFRYWRAAARYNEAASGNSFTLTRSNRTLRQVEGARDEFVGADTRGGIEGLGRYHNLVGLGPGGDVLDTGADLFRRTHDREMFIKVGVEPTLRYRHNRQPRQESRKDF